MSSADNGYVSVNCQIAVSAKAGERWSWSERWRSSKSNKQTNTTNMSQMTEVKDRKTSETDAPSLLPPTNPHSYMDRIKHLGYFETYNDQSYCM